MHQFKQKLILLKGHIKKWNKESFCNIFQAKQALERKIKLNQSQGMNSRFSEELRIQEKLLIQEFSQREQQEEVYWNQKARFKGLQEGERNTRFFRKVGMQHRQGNRLDRLNMEDGNIVETQEETTLNS